MLVPRYRSSSTTLREKSTRDPENRSRIFATDRSNLTRQITTTGTGSTDQSACVNLPLHRTYVFQLTQRMPSPILVVGRETSRSNEETRPEMGRHPWYKDQDCRPMMLFTDPILPALRLSCSCI